MGWVPLPAFFNQKTTGGQSSPNRLPLFFLPSFLSLCVCVHKFILLCRDCARVCVSVFPVYRLAHIQWVPALFIANLNGRFSRRRVAQPVDDDDDDECSMNEFKFTLTSLYFHLYFLLYLKVS